MAEAERVGLDTPPDVVNQIVQNKCSETQWHSCHSVFCQGTDDASIETGQILMHVDSLYDVVQVHVVNDDARGIPQNTERERSLVLARIQAGTFRPRTDTTVGPPACTFSTLAELARESSAEELRDKLGVIKLEPRSGREVVVAFEFSASDVEDVRVPTLIDARGHWTFEPADADEPTGWAVSPRNREPGLPEVVHRGIPSQAVQVRVVPGEIERDWWET